MALPASGGMKQPALVTVGDVTDTGAVVWARGRSSAPITVRYGEARGAPETSQEIKLSAGADFTGKAVLAGLTPGGRYRYTVSQAGHDVTGEFVTAPAAGVPAPVRFVWSGDLGSRTGCRHLSEGYPIFRALAGFEADFFVFVGDTIYADHPCGGADRVPGYQFIATTLAQYRAKHRYNREDPDVQAYFRSVSVYATWDDHDVRNNFSGPAEALMPVGREAFLDYFPIQPPAEEAGRLYRRFRWGRLLDLFLLDTRQYRSHNAQRDGPGKTMLGAAQKRWLIESVSASPAVWKVVVSSVPLSVPTGGKEHDSWSNANVLGFPEENGTGFAVERDAVLRAFRQRGVRNLVFLAADVHHAELIRHYPTADWSFHEFIAGPLSASLGRPRPLDNGLNPRSLFAMGGVENFGHVSVDATGLTVRIVDGTGAVRFTHSIGPET